MIKMGFGNGGLTNIEKGDNILRSEKLKKENEH